MYLLILFFFFFSSRRRHTRWNCDWSSDVCSSDLYGDVQAAFYEVNLCPVSSHSEGQVTAKTRALFARTRSQTLAAMPAAKVAEWESEFAPLAHTMASALPASRLVDVCGEFARPWSLALAVRVTGADPKDVERLLALAARVSMATADPENTD